MTEHAAALYELEHAAWEALSTSGEAAASYYAEVLAGEILLLLPGGLVMDDRAAVVESMSGDPWEHYQLQDERVTTLGDGAAVISYRGTARRGDVEYTALFTSTYVRDGGDWKLVLHQQTPV